MRQDTTPYVSRFAVESAFALCTMGFGALIITGALEFSIGWGDIGPEPGYFPFRVGTLIICASIVNLARAVLQRDALAAEIFLTGAQTRNVIAFAVPVVVLVGVTLGLGIYVGAALYLLYAVGYAGRHRAWLTVVVSLGTPIVLFLLFEYVFLTPLLKGPLEHLLGWY
jgi:hypothetical protein